jgi:hypothetical protein
VHSVTAMAALTDRRDRRRHRRTQAVSGETPTP